MSKARDLAAVRPSKGAGSVATNTAVGVSALAANTTGSINTAVGYQALQTNDTGVNNTAVGLQALRYNTTGGNNAAVSYGALYSNTTGGSNTAVGTSALQANTTASNNTAVGYQAGYTNATGTQNVFIGNQAGYTSNVSGSARNTIIGNQAGFNLTTATANTFIGAGPNGGAGETITTGSKNSILGAYNGNQGGLDIRTASNYIVLSDGDGNPRIVSNNTGKVGIGTVSPVQVLDVYANTADYSARVLQDNTGGSCLLTTSNSSGTSNTYLTGYSSSTGAIKVIIYTNGNIVNTNNSYGAYSDVKLKENIVDATPKLEDLCKVKVRQYNLKSDPNHKQIGVVAQELEEVFAGLIDETSDKDIDGNDLGTTTKSVKYSVFVPMLIKAIQELNAKVEAQAAQIALQSSEIATLTLALKGQA